MCSGVWLHMENKIFCKTISVDCVKYAFDPEMVLHFYFHYKPFPGLWERERERDHLPHSSLTQYSPSSLTRTSLRSHIQAPASRTPASARSRHEPTHRSTHPVSDPLLDRPTTFRLAHLVHRRVAPTNRSLSVPLSRLVLWFWFFCLDFCFLCCLYILILCNNICLHPKKMWETW